MLRNVSNTPKDTHTDPKSNTHARSQLLHTDDNEQSTTQQIVFRQRDRCEATQNVK